ncbi:MAG TPA: hypothetical protein PKK15_01285 [Kouleothrix sp.]|uniref:hypothetical protein n=1 Tax=Kouleothrix sp. TaxID=2779161 RepID=UPI002C9FD445|nr:hypothetical protein [Kouleothrix sp.]
MRDFFRFERRDLILFLVCTVIYALVFFAWTVLPLNGDRSLADTDAIAAGIPVLGDLPTQSVSKLVVTGALYLLSLVYALVSAASSDDRRSLGQLIVISALTFLGWMALNFWVVSGFLNSPATLLYGGASVVLLVVWAGALARGVSSIHDALARFLVRFGLALALFITVVQLAALLTPEWRSPTQGIPVLYTLTLNALVGVFISGFGGNMLWRERRVQVLAASKKR